MQSVSCSEGTVSLETTCLKELLGLAQSGLLLSTQGYSGGSRKIVEIQTDVDQYSEDRVVLPGEEESEQHRAHTGLQPQLDLPYIVLL